MRCNLDVRILNSKNKGTSRVSYSTPRNYTQRFISLAPETLMGQVAYGKEADGQGSIIVDIYAVASNHLDSREIQLKVPEVLEARQGVESSHGP